MPWVPLKFAIDRMAAEGDSADLTIVAVMLAVLVLGMLVMLVYDAVRGPFG